MSAEHLSSIGDEEAFLMQWGKGKIEGGTVMSFRWGFSDSSVKRWRKEGTWEYVALRAFCNNYIMYFKKKTK